MSLPTHLEFTLKTCLSPSHITRNTHRKSSAHCCKLPEIHQCCCCQVVSVMFNSVQPHRRQPTRLTHPWDSPGRNTGVGCHFLLQCTKVKSESEVAQSCPTLHDPMDCSLPGSSLHGIFQTRVLEWGVITRNQQCLCTQSLCHVQLCEPKDCSLPGSSVHGTFQARILERVAISFCR